MLILYCETCGRRVTDAELANGQATKLDDNRAVCAECSPAQVPLPAATPVRSVASGKSPPKGSAPNPEFRASPSQGTPAVPLPALRIGSSSDHITPVRSTKSGKTVGARKTGLHHETRGNAHQSGTHEAADSSALMLMAAAGGIIVIVGLYFVFAGGSSSSTSNSTLKKDTETAVARVTPETAPSTPPVRSAVPPPSSNDTRTPSQTRIAEPAMTETENPASARKTEVAPGKDDDDMVNFRNDLAAGKLKEAKSFAQQNPNDPWGYKERLDGITSSYKSTPAGVEATKLLAELKLPEKPAPVEPAAATPAKGAGEWKLAVGKNIKSISSQSATAWRMNGDVIENIPGIDNSAQSAEDYGDGEYRVRFQTEQAGSVFFSFRQGDGFDTIRFSGPSLKSINDGAVHELLCVCRGDHASGKLDGKAVVVVTEGAPRQGRIQFNAHEGKLKIYSIEWRKLER